MESGRSYVALMENVSVSILKSLIEFTAPTNRLVTLLEAWISQTVSETSTMETAQIIRKTAVGTGTVFTARPLAENAAAYGGTVRTDLTVEGTLGNIMHMEGFNILNGWYYKPVPEARIWVAPGGFLAVRFGVAPAAALTVSAGMIFAEVG